MEYYDAIIIGSGQAGTPLAKKLAAAGKKTALIEKRWVGGTCVNDGCTPTKAMIASARTAQRARTAPQLGVEAGPVTVDLKKIKARKDEIVTSFRSAAQKGLEAADGVDLIFGEATFTGRKELMVTATDGGKHVLSADWIFINTGTIPAIPQIKGLAETDYLTSTTLLDLEVIPKHLAVVGGNYIGLELGQLFHRLGSKVTIVEKSARIADREDEDVSAELTELLRNEGIQILPDAEIDGLEKVGDEIRIALTVEGQPQCVMASHLLLATGRTPQTEGLNLAGTDVATDKKGNIIVDERLATNVEGIYALGDVNGGPAFTHMAYNDHLIVYKNLIEHADCLTTDRLVPYCLFTDPQLARVGLSEAEANRQGLDVLVAKLPMAKAARSIETSETLGFMKAVVDRKTKALLGVCVLASEGGELMAVLQMAMEGGITYDRIREQVFAHPTFSESLNNLFMTLDD